MIPDEDGIHVRVDEDAYHADRGSLSVSGAKLLLPPSCPAKFRERMDNPPEASPVFDFGHLAHKLVLGEGAEIVGIDAPDYRTKDAREARDQAHTQGKIPALKGEIVKATAMAEAVLSDPVAGPLFTSGTAEVALYHTDPDTGLRLRGRCDWITNSGDIIDYKTSVTANPAELERKMWSLGYHMQAAWYIDLAMAVGAVEREPAFKFVVQEKVPPHVVTVVQYDTEAIVEGRAANHRAKELYERCRDTGLWPAYTDTEVTISLPRWALRDGIRTDADNLIAELERIQS